MDVGLRMYREEANTFVIEVQNVGESCMNPSKWAKELIISPGAETDVYEEENERMHDDYKTGIATL